MYGFWRINVDSLENVIDKTLCLPCKEYRLFSNEEIMSEIFPRYIGISIEQVNYWAINSTFEPKHEWGSCWRVAYKRQFLIDNDIRFNEHIILNEDSMFNANALVYASSIVTINEGLYNYYIRKSGSMKKALSNSLVDNKYALFLERKRIVELIHNSKINYGFEVYAGSIVFGIIEMMSSANFREWKKISNILKDKHIKECIKKMPYVKNKKFSFSLFFIKNHMPFLLFIILFVLKKFGVNIKKNI